MGDLRPRMPGDAADKPRLTWFDFVITAVALIVGQIDELVGAGTPGLLGRSAAAEVLTLAAGLSLLARRRWPLLVTLFVAACHLLAFTPFVFAVMMYTMGVITRQWWQLGVLSVFGVGRAGAVGGGGAGRRCARVGVHPVLRPGTAAAGVCRRGPPGPGGQPAGAGRGPGAGTGHDGADRAPGRARPHRARDARRGGAPGQQHGRHGDRAAGGPARRRRPRCARRWTASATRAARR